MTTVFDVPERRIDGLSKATGTARYTADRRPPDALVVRVLASDRAHALVRRVDTRAARAVPGVHAVVTGSDAGGARFGRRLLDWPVLGWDRVRFVGDRVAAVAADTEDAAETALEAITVEYEDVPPVFDPAAALAPDAPVLHPDAGAYRYLGGTRPPVSHPNVQGELLVTKGAGADADAFAALFRAAAHTFEHEFRTGRQHQVALEPHGATVTVEPDGRTRIASTNKAPFSLRGQVAAAFDLPPDTIEIESTIIGGDFGGKGLSVDEYIGVLLARASARPVAIGATFEEELRGYGPRHGGLLRLRSAVTSEGRIVAHDADLIFDGGAYAAAKPVPELIPPGALDVMAPYAIPNVRIRIRAVYTNTVPGGHMRCPGELQAAFASESHVDLIARRLGHDPIAFRLLNAVRAGATSSRGERIHDPMAVPVLERVMRERRPSDRSDTGFGVGLVARRMEGGRQAISLAPTEDGRVRLLTGLADQGAGAHTALARIAAAVLGIPSERVFVEQQTTAVAPPDLGIGASRVTYIAGRATQDAARRLAASLAELAGGHAQPFESLAAEAARQGIVAQGTFDSELEEHGDAHFTFAAVGATVAVDRATGTVAIDDAVVVADTGTIVNPIAHAGQIEGGFAQGLGAALMEELVIEDGQVQTANLSEYRIPTATDVPRPRLVALDESPGPGAFGGKMAGELSPACVPGAIANAIHDAVGVRIFQIPMTPERVLRALRSERAANPDYSNPDALHEARNDGDNRDRPIHA